MANLLSDTINFIVPFCRYQSANIGTSNMPIVGIANIVRNIILAAPFTWRFNRKVNTFLSGNNALQQGVQDYAVSIPDMGFIENVAITDPSIQASLGIINTWQLKDVLNNKSLAFSSTQARPEVVAIHSDDGAGNLILRFSAIPDKPYNVTITYQAAPTQFAGTGTGWAPIPDSFSDIYNNMTLGYYMDSCQDPRAREYVTRGLAGLLSRAQGLSQMDKAIFAASYMNFSAQQLLNLIEAQQQLQAKGAR